MKMGKNLNRWMQHLLWKKRGEVYRVYFKGLVGDEEDEKMVFGGIGVAIYDAGDRCVFELQKPFLFEGNKAVDGYVAEVNALIEALNAVVAMGLKRVDILCDTYPIYLYLTGKWLPKQGQILTLVDQLSLLRKKIAHSSSSFVTQDKIKYAYELARDAILFQASKHSLNFDAKKLTETCAICLEDIYNAQIFSVNGCLHRFCFSCMRKHTEAKLHQGRSPNCPHVGCTSELKIENCIKFLTPKLYAIMSMRIKEKSIPAREKIYCPFSACSTLMSKAEVGEYATTLCTYARQSGARKCIKCQTLFCINCKVPWHDNMTCFDYKRQNPYPDGNEAKLKSLATMKHWRQCSNCDNMVELATGCNHIYCRCGYEFCYCCGAPWQNKKQTCNCPVWDQRNITIFNHLQ